MGPPPVALGIVIQARMGSTRLPGKVLRPIGGRPLLDHILDRLAKVRHPARVVVATGDTLRDDVVAEFCAARGVDCFRGSEQDVLARYYECARARALEQVIRLTGDNPFTDVDELDRLVEFHLAGAYDYSSSLEGLPVGVGAEIFSFPALERSFLEGLAPHHREHVDEYILENRALFRTGRLAVPKAKRRPDVRLTVDTPEDLRRADFIAQNALGARPTTEEAIGLCSRFV
jgi:spore coat polysaccharide biosynthesis protein SpsF